MTAANGSSAYEFDLPPELIAQDPPEERGDSRLLLVDPAAGVGGEVVFRQLPGLLRSGDLLVLNESRVMPARLATVRPDTGGSVEILLVRPVAGKDTWLALARPQRRLRPGVRLNVVTSPAESPGAPPPYLEIVAKRDAGYVEVSAPEGPAALAEAWGRMPLPPYIRRPAGSATGRRDQADRERYQTVYAAGDGTGAGSVAAPTAGLHFSQRTLAGLEDAGIAVARVALHVGPGTFRPPSEEQLARGRLHREYFRLPEAVTVAAAATRERGGRVIAVGTTSLRVLETAARLGLDAPGPDHRDFGATAADPEPVFCGYAAKGTDGWEVCGETRLFLRPPERVTAVDGLLTNFHLPGSSLLMLVATLTGQSGWRPVYDHAVANRMRFYSYGDCMLILPGLRGPAESR
jgi:S-adenosylmethionine:tRNA ribosyltransferase-isomerase